MSGDTGPGTPHRSALRGDGGFCTPASSNDTRQAGWVTEVMGKLIYLCEMDLISCVGANYHLRTHPRVLDAPESGAPGPPVTRR